ncbi:hypothetical protein FNT36_03255 [Hymenobacter setariae]|uniref:Uncharacterized protein n=1 Tax=Hymenobacter setariae TaxID=2594794 RepID=A0A558C329_9BACT|nr:hypothetical protein [Hymenobacter setariae]TVT43124.1 hypothetical protein FNT36_03255 [Hymenobacter setariae]
MGVKVLRIYQLDGIVNARLELVGGFFEVEVPAGPVAGGFQNKRLSFEQLADLLGGGGGQLTADQVAALQVPGANANNQFVLNNDYRLDPNLLHLLPVGSRCYMYGPDDGSNQYGKDGTGIGHVDNVYGFGMSGGTFGDNHYNNTYDSGLTDSAFGDSHNGNTYGAGLQQGTFGKSHRNNHYANDTVRCTFRDNHTGNTYGNGLSDSTFGSNNRYNIVGDNCSDIITGTGVNECQIGPNCSGIQLGINCKNVKVFDTRNGSNVTDPTGVSRLVIPAGTQNAVYRRGVLETANSGTPGTPGTGVVAVDVSGDKRKQVAADIAASVAGGGQARIQEPDTSFTEKHFTDNRNPSAPYFFWALQEDNPDTSTTELWWNRFRIQ